MAIEITASLTRLQATTKSPDRSGLFLLLLFGAACERIVRGTQGKPDRHARHVEGFAQAVDEIAHIGLRHRIGARAGNDEARRARLYLRHVLDLEATARDCRRRLMRDDARQPAVETAGRYAAVPDFMGLDDILHELVDTLPAFA